MDQRARSTGFAIALAIVVLVLMPPFVGPGVRRVIMDGFAAICHQLPGRSAHVNGISLAVCHRCLGIYLGMLTAAPIAHVLHRWIKNRQEWAPSILLASLVPLSIDWAVDAVGIVDNVPLSRAITGWIFGLVAGYFLITAIDDLLESTARRRSRAVEDRSPNTPRTTP